ncbi:replication initiation factor domain-containing protein [Lactiplantibacillus pentosus]
MRKVTVKLDRITVSGVLPNWSLQDIHDETGLIPRDGAMFLEREDKDGNTENMAFMAESPFQREHWRLDFNPANLTADETSTLGRVIDNMDQAHFTRLDIAFDVFNDDLAMKYRVYRFNTREDVIETIKGRSKSVETMYWGARKSDQQIRLYNKLVEQKNKQKAIPAGVESWARLELQLRGKKPAEWLNSATEMLNQFKLANLQMISAKDRAILYALTHDIIEWQEISVATRSKYRKMIKQSDGFETELADEMKQVLADNLDELQAKLNGYLADFDIQK